MKNMSHGSERVILSLVLTFMLVFGCGLPAMAVTGAIVSIESFAGGQGGTAASSNMANTIYFGNYWQNTTSTSGSKEAIQWRVLSNNSGKTFLMADKALYADAPTNGGAVDYHWSESPLRDTLNCRSAGGGFAGDAFSEAEWVAIATTNLSDEGTNDKLFILSVSEAENSSYGFASSDARKAYATTFANNVMVYGNGGTAYTDGVSGDRTWWWLRTRDWWLMTERVGGYGNILGESSFTDYNSVRPCLNLDTSKILFLTSAYGGKGEVGVGDGFNIDTDYDGSYGWKLTLYDTNIAKPAVSSVTLAASEESITVDKLAEKASKTKRKVINLSRGYYLAATKALQVTYSGLVTGENKYVSAVVLDNTTGELLNYAKIGTEASGTVEVDTTNLDQDTTYKIRIFAEEENGDYMTDYASQYYETSFTTHPAIQKTSDQLSATHANDGLTVLLGGSFDLTFEDGTYDTNVTTVMASTPKLTADPTNGTELAGNVTLLPQTQLTMKNNFTLSGNLFTGTNSNITAEDKVTISGNLFANTGANIDARDLTMTQGSVINFNNLSQNPFTRTNYKTFCVGKNANSGDKFTADNTSIIMNTNIESGNGDKLDLSSAANPANLTVSGSANVQVLCDPLYETGTGFDGNLDIIYLPNVTATTKDTLKVTTTPTTWKTAIYTPVVSYDGDSKTWKITSFKAEANETTKSVGDTASIMSFAWLQTVNNLQKRMGDLRGGEASNMAWARFQRNNDDLDTGRGLSLSGNLYQVGYDFLIGSNKVAKDYFGLSLDVFDGSQSFKIGGGDAKSTTVSAYYTKIYESGHYFDFIFRYGRLENDTTSYDSAVVLPAFTTTKLDYALNSFTLSGEYGYRWNMGKSGLYLEPQAELTYGYLSGANKRSSTGILADIDSTNHFLTRLGLAFGQRVNNFNYYLRGSYYHDFAGTTNVKYGGTSFQQDSAENWWEVSLGGGWNISKVSYFYAELIKHFKDVSNSLNFNVGFRLTL